MKIFNSDDFFRRILFHIHCFTLPYTLSHSLTYLLDTSSQEEVEKLPKESIYRTKNESWLY